MLKKYETLSANCSSKIIMSGTIKNASITKSYFRDSLLLILSSKYLASNKIEYRKYLPGCNLFFNRNLKNKIVFPGFQSGEDILMTKKVSKENVKLVLIGPNVVEHITTKNLHQYSIELGTSSYMISIRGDKFEKSLIPFKLILGSLYKLFKIIYNVVRYRSYGLPKLLFYLPGVIIASLFYHLGIFYGLIKSKNNI